MEKTLHSGNEERKMAREKLWFVVDDEICCINDVLKDDDGLYLMNKVR